MSELLSGQGRVSSTRVAMLAIVAMVIFNYTYVTVKTGVLAVMPIELVYLVAACLGLKGWQKVTEARNGKPPGGG